MSTPQPSEPSDIQLRHRSVEVEPTTVVENKNRSPLTASPYTNARSPSGHLTPHSPVPERRHSQVIPWITGSRSSLHDEPSSVNPESAAASILGTNIGTIHDNHTPTSDLRLSHPSSSPHQSIDFSREMSPGIKSSPRAAHIHFEKDFESRRSRTPMSVKSSQPSVSHKSHNSQNSTGRASYRTHHGPLARERTPTPLQYRSFHGTPDPTTPTRHELGHSAAPSNVTAPPSAHDPNQPGELVKNGPSSRFFPMSADSALRYESRKIRSPSGFDYDIKAMLYEYPETPEVPGGWTAYRHPEGGLYFVHDKSKTFTEVDMCDDEVHEEVDYYRKFLLSELEKEIEERGLSDSLKADEVQLVLEPKVDREGVMCCYYFVNPRARSLFWLDEWGGSNIFNGCRGVLSTPHKVILDAPTSSGNFRRHWDLYPNFCKITQELKDEVIDMILHATCDHLTSHRSSCPLDPEELTKHLSLIERIDPEKSGKRGHRAIIIGRIMHVFYDAYFNNFYGEDCARLNFDQTVHGWRYHPSLFMTIFAPLLFMLPIKNVRLLHKIFVEDIIASQQNWNTFITKLNSQLQASSVLATVLLNANVGFLPKESGPTTSSGFLSYMSLVASMASIILGLVLLGRPTATSSTRHEAIDYLHRLHHVKYGLETLAIVYSLPHAFLMWGMFLFFAAFSVQWYYPDDMALRTCIGAFLSIVVVSVGCCIWTARDRCNFWWFQPDPKEKELYKEPDEEESGNKGWGFLSGLAIPFKKPTIS